MFDGVCQLPSKLTGGKLLVLDEAHKFMDGVVSDGLSQAIVNAARLMRHDGMRLIVSTQSPKALAPELLELVTLAILHRFHSRDWLVPSPLCPHHYALTTLTSPL